MMNKINRSNKTFILLLIISIPLFANTQIIREISSRPGISIRGLSVVNDAILWVSGTKGTVGRSTDGGKTIQWMMVPGYTERDFRDIEAFDKKTAIIMAIDTPAMILKTVDGGKIWKKVFEDTRAGMFLDALYFSDEKNGVVVGDPVNQRFFLAMTKNGGERWSILSERKSATAENGEALFAASGTNIMLISNEPLFVSGGIKTHLIKGNKKIALPLLTNKSSTGANAAAKAEDNRLIIVGGDYLMDTISTGNCIISDDYGKTFITPHKKPYGYKSCITYLDKLNWISCGTSGVDISTDHGINWKHISDESFHVVQKAKKGNKVFLAGNGRITELYWQ